MNLQELSDEELIKGIQKSYFNAVDLLDEAYLLGHSEKFPRGYALCQISIEEFAKCSLLFGLLMERLEKSEIDYEKFNRDFTSHKRKMEHGIDWEITMFEFFKYQSGKDFVDKIIEKSNDYKKQIDELNELKNESLYVDVKNTSFQSPSETIDKEKFDKIFGVAALRKMMLQIFGKFDESALESIKSSYKENSDNVEDTPNNS